MIASVAGRAVHGAVRLAQCTGCTTRCHDGSAVWARADIGQTGLQAGACTRAEAVASIAGRAVNCVVCLAKGDCCYANRHSAGGTSCSAVWTRADIGQTGLQTCACTGAEMIASVAGRAVHGAVRLAQRTAVIC
eukprot:COSAG01_NODE_7835_length_3034_cov_2.171380_4_plen_134_part_00